jgi:hypothetical protein
LFFHGSLLIWDEWLDISFLSCSNIGAIRNVYRMALGNWFFRRLVEVERNLSFLDVDGSDF